MNESNWLKLSGLMRRCLYNSENPQCPFTDYRQQDYFQQSQILDQLSDQIGEQMLVACGSCRNNCKIVQNKVVAINNSRNFRVIG